MNHPECIAEIDWQNWRPDDTDTLVFVVKNARVLLIRKKRGLGAGKINGPGGKIEPGESPLNCAIRETEEELCITPLHMEKRAELRFQSNDFGKILGHVFIATDYEGEPEETDEAIPIWTQVGQLPFEEMWEDDIFWLPQVLFGKSVRGEFLFDGESLIDFRVSEVSPDKDW